MKVSIITVTYNSSDTIADCVKSVAAQTYPDIEHIIIDGASTDNTTEIVRSLPNRVKRIVSEPDTGIYDAMNKGIKLAMGEVIGILNSDDLYENNTVIEMIANSFNNDEEVEAIHADLFYVKKDDTNKIVRYWKTKEFYTGAFAKGWHPAHPTLFVRKEMYENYGVFDLNFKLAADFELMLRFFERYKINSKYLPEPIIRMRLGGATSKNMKNIINQNIECYKAFKTNNLSSSVFYPIYRLMPKLKQYFND